MSDKCRDLGQSLLLHQTDKSLSNHQATANSEQMFQGCGRGVGVGYIHSMKMNCQHILKECFGRIGFKISMCLRFVLTIVFSEMELYLILNQCIIFTFSENLAQ